MLYPQISFDRERCARIVCMARVLAVLRGAGIFTVSLVPSHSSRICANLLSSFGYDRHSLMPCEKSRNFRPIIHRDIKPENILLRLPLRGHQVPTKDEDHPYPSIVLADFGLSVLAHDGWPVGTDIWQPPEIPFHSTKSDVWSVGAVVHAMAAQGQSPIGPLPDHLENNPDNQTWWCRQPEARQPYAYFTSYSYRLADAMHLAFARNPVRRPTSLEILLRVEREMEDPEFPLRTPRKPLDECIFSEDWPDWL